MMTTHQLTLMKKLLSCRINDELMTKLTVLAAEETIKRREKVGIGELIERWHDAGLVGNNASSANASSQGSKVSDDKVKRLQEENERLDHELEYAKQTIASTESELAKLRVTRKEDDPSLVKQAVEVAVKNCREELEKVKADRDKWKASAETFRAKLAPGLKTAGDLASERETATNYLKK